MSSFKQIKSILRRKCQLIFPYKYKSKRYSDTFLNSSVKINHLKLKVAPEVVYCFWTGTNEMNENRKRAVESLQNKAEVTVKLINPANLNTYILSDFPMHPAYGYLSLVHKSDYLRCYFMYHYGGGYSDVKECKSSWKNAFDVINKSDKQVLGYFEINHKAVAQLSGKLGKDLRHYYLTVLGNCAYICRPNSSFTLEWYNELHKRLDYYLPELIKNPGNVLGDNEGYPIPWTGILGGIFHPLCLKYSNDLIGYDNIKPDFNNYR